MTQQQQVPATFDSSEILIFNCPICEFITLKMNRLESHVQAHGMFIEIDIYECGHCGVVCTSRDIMEEHCEILHPGQAGGIKKRDHKKFNESMVNQAPRFVCEFCKFKGANQEKLAMHLQKFHDFVAPSALGDGSSGAGGALTNGKPSPFADMPQALGVFADLKVINLQPVLSTPYGPYDIVQPGIYLLERDRANVWGRLCYVKEFLAKPTANEMLESLRQNLNWSQQKVKRRDGTQILEPRLSYYHGPPYEFSGVCWGEDDVAEWPTKLAELKGLVETACGQTFNAAVGTMYRHGRDSMGWHSDNETELGAHPAIASISFGQPRIFEFKRKGREDRIVRVLLGPGDLLLTDGSIQQLWKHAVNKDQSARNCRLNFCFHQVTPKPADKRRAPSVKSASVPAASGDASEGGAGTKAAAAEGEGGKGGAAAEGGEQAAAAV